jgi:hypothetical protein
MCFIKNNDHLVVGTKEFKNHVVNVDWTSGIFRLQNLVLFTGIVRYDAKRGYTPVLSDLILWRYSRNQICR